MQYNAKQAINSRKGKANRQEGAEFEKYIERSCEYYREKGIALIEKRNQN